MNSIVKYLLITLVTAALIIMPGCRKFLDPGLPHTEIRGTDIFSDDQSAISAVSGLYSYMTNSLSIGNGAEALYGGLSSDELVNISSSPSYDPFTFNSIKPDDYTIEGSFWGWAYNKIYHINSILEGLENSSLQDPGLKSQLRGEMLVARALFYIHLHSFFGNTPLITSTDYAINAAKPAATGIEIMNQVIADLQEAESLISDQYISNGHTRPEKPTATALLARAFLYNKNWVAAEAKASDIINSGRFQLETNLSDVFESGSTARTISLSVDSSLARF